MELKMVILKLVLFSLYIIVSGANQCISELPPDPNSQCCGIDVTTRSRIIGGKPTSLRQYPWLALIEYFSVTNYGPYYFCGASLISSRYVITAAHCVTGGSIDKGFKVTAVRLGDYDITNPGADCVNLRGGKDCTTAISIPVEKITVNKNYFMNSTRILNDIALIRLKRPAPYNDHIRPICLPYSDVTVYGPPKLRLSVAGWGTMEQRKKTSSNGFENFDSNVKRHVIVPHISNKKCTDYWPQINESQICAGEKGKNHCEGDSGGPLMYNRWGVYEVVGIVSFTAAGEFCDARPGVHTKVFHFMTWIMKQIQSEAGNIKRDEEGYVEEDGGDVEDNEIGDVEDDARNIEGDKEDKIKWHEAGDVKEKETEKTKRDDADVKKRISGASPPQGFSLRSYLARIIISLFKSRTS